MPLALQARMLRVLQKQATVLPERLLLREHFGLSRLSGESPFIVGAAGRPGMLVCIAGGGQLSNYAFDKGDVLLVPVVVGGCSCRPRAAISLLEISLPDGA